MNFNGYFALAMFFVALPFLAKECNDNDAKFIESCRYTCNPKLVAYASADKKICYCDQTKPLPSPLTTPEIPEDILKKYR